MSITLVTPARLAEVAAEHHIEPHHGPHTDSALIDGLLYVARLDVA